MSSKSNEPIQANPQSASEGDLQVAQGGGLGDWINDKMRDITGVNNIEEAAKAVKNGDGAKAGTESLKFLLKLNPTSEITPEDTAGLGMGAGRKLGEDMEKQIEEKR